jgi:transposase-like protein
MLSPAIVLAIAVTANGERRARVALGPSEIGALWLPLLRDLAACGLSGIKLRISEAHRRVEDGELQACVRL